MSQMTAMPQNFRKSVDWILGAYADAGVTLPNGFQKDAIQNAAGARRIHNWDNWGCDISLISNSKGLFLVIEDRGTEGLTGKNLAAEEVNTMMAEGVELPPTERLARFTSMFNSGGNTTGGGLFGAGKSVYSFASKDYTYYYDTLRDDELYIANTNSGGQILTPALENNVAKDFISEKTGLRPKQDYGTRIIICNPKDELVDAIRDGSFVEYIQESWWLIIERLGENSAITVNGKAVEIPQGIKDAAKKFELSSPEIFAEGFKVKHFGLYVFENNDIPWSGISYYRKGMKIGDIEFRDKDVPEKLQDKYWGYVEVDELWEDELAKIEDSVHFGVSKGKKKAIAYQNLKNYCSQKLKENFIKWGFIKEQRDDSQKLRTELKKLAEELQSEFHRMGFENLGVGPEKPDFEIRLQNISYPVTGSEEVTGGDQISYSLLVKNNFHTEKDFEIRSKVIEPSTNTLIHTIGSERFILGAGATQKIDFSLDISSETARRYSENRISISTSVPGSSKRKNRELRFYYDVDEPTGITDNVVLKLHECVLPTEGSRRVNFGDVIQQARYCIHNNRISPLNYKLNISVHNAEDPTCPKIVDVASLTGSVEPYEEAITAQLPDILFDEKTYSKYLEKGKLELRARLIANSTDAQYEKGDKVTFYNFKLYLNTDEKNGLMDAFEIQSIVAPDDYRRSWCTPGVNRSITLNVGHIAYKGLEDEPEYQTEYLREEMIKQFVLLYLKEGKYDMFEVAGTKFADAEPYEAAEIVIDKIESIYNELLK